MSVRSPARRGVQLWLLFLCSTLCDEYFHFKRFVPAGAIYLHDYSSIQVDGSSSFTNNKAGGSGGERHPKIASANLRKAAAWLFRCFPVACSNIIDIDDGSCTDLLKKRFFVLITLNDRVFVGLSLHRVC